MADTNKNPETRETTDSLEINKSTLNPLLEEYFKEKKTKDLSNINKDSFLRALETLSPEEKRKYRDYVYQVIKGEITQINSSLTQTIDSLSSIDKLEVYAAICNHCKQDLTFELPTPPKTAFAQLQERNIPTEYLGYKEPDFTIHGGKITLKNGISQDFGNLYTEYMGDGQYKLHLEDLGLKQDTFLVITRNEKGGITVYGKDGYKEFETQKFTKKIIFPVSSLGLSVEMNVDKI